MTKTFDQYLDEVEARAEKATKQEFACECISPDDRLCAECEFQHASYADVPALVRHCRELREALSFYAEKGSKDGYADDSDVITAEGDSEIIDEVPGRRARAALASLPPGEK